jgi:hypothetical protein
MAQGPNDFFYLPQVTTAERVATLLRARELVYDTTLGAIFVGDGVTTGGTALASGAGGVAFRKTVTLAPAAAATGTVILADTDVGASHTVFITDILVNVGGATAWTDVTATIVKIQDTSAVVGVTIAKAGLTANAALFKNTANVTLGAPILTGVGFTLGKGIKVVGDALFSAGSTLNVTVVGFLA